MVGYFNYLSITFLSYFDSLCKNALNAVNSVYYVFRWRGSFLVILTINIPKINLKHLRNCRCAHWSTPTLEKTDLSYVFI